MKNLVVFFDYSRDIRKLVNKYQKSYHADVYEIKAINNISFFDKLSSSFFNTNIPINKCNLNLLEYENIILISPLWFNKIPSPIIKFLEPQVGKINNILYVLYNYNKNDYPKEFDKLDKILNLRRSNSYFVSLNSKDIHVRVYQ